MTNPSPHKIRQATFIKDSPEKVYDTLTSAEHWNSFFTHASELDPKPGGKFIWRWKNWGPDFYSVEVDGKVVAAERPHRFCFEWGNKRRSRIDIRLTAEHGGTVLRLQEDGYTDSPEDQAMMLECAAGWGEAITLLKFYIEHGIIYTPPEKDR